MVDYLESILMKKVGQQKELNNYGRRKATTN